MSKIYAFMQLGISYLVMMMVFAMSAMMDIGMLICTD